MVGHTSDSSCGEAKMRESDFWPRVRLCKKKKKLPLIIEIKTKTL